MPNPNNDDVAKALERLAAGQAYESHAPSDDVSHVTRPAASAPQTPPPAARAVVPTRPLGPKAVPQPKPVAGRPASGTPAASRPLQPPGSAAPPAPRPPGASDSPAPSAARPAAARAATLTTARPAAPFVAEQPQSIQSEVIEDDDRVIVPAPSAEVFTHRGSGAAARTSSRKSLSLRRTFIPILLTAGFILFTLGVLRFLWQGNNPLLGLQPWLVALMFVFALALWGLAALNMLAVKHQIEASAARPEK